MSTLEKDIYAKQRISSNKKDQSTKSRAYRGVSTVNPENKGFTLYDLAIIKQDLINHFHIRVGEKLENPNFGTIIWDLLYEPMTEEIKRAIADNVTTIVNYDPRVQVDSIDIETYESGILIDCRLTYLPYNISESMRLKFDEENGLLS